MGRSETTLSHSFWHQACFAFVLFCIALVLHQPCFVVGLVALSGASGAPSRVCSGVEDAAPRQAESAPATAQVDLDGVRQHFPHRIGQGPAAARVEHTCPAAALSWPTRSDSPLASNVQRPALRKLFPTLPAAS